MSEQILLLQGQYFNDDEWHTILEDTRHDYLEKRMMGSVGYAGLDSRWHRARIVSKDAYLKELEDVKKIKEFDKLTEGLVNLSDEQILHFRKQVGLS